VQNIRQLEAALHREWQQLSRQGIRRLTGGMRRRVEADIRARGGYTRYWALNNRCPLCIIDTGNCVPGKRENNDWSHTRGRNFIIYSCLYLYYVVKELYANL
jgi:hypothetical protein